MGRERKEVTGEEEWERCKSQGKDGGTDEEDEKMMDTLEHTDTHIP